MCGSSEVENQLDFHCSFASSSLLICKSILRGWNASRRVETKNLSSLQFLANSSCCSWIFSISSAISPVRFQNQCSRFFSFLFGRNKLCQILSSESLTIDFIRSDSNLYLYFQLIFREDFQLELKTKRGEIALIITTILQMIWYLKGHKMNMIMLLFLV